MDEVVGKLDQALSSGDNNTFIQATVQSIKKLYEVTKEQSGFLNRHAELHEMHHRPFFSASQAVKKLREFAATAENEVVQIKDAMTKMRNDLDNMKNQDVDPMKDAVKDFNERLNATARILKKERPDHLIK